MPSRKKSNAQSVIWRGMHHIQVAERAICHPTTNRTLPPDNPPGCEHLACLDVSHLSIRGKGIHLELC